MRISMVLAAGSAILLAACGDGTTVDDPSDPDQIAAAAANLPDPEPGQYRTTGELVTFEAPGAPAEELEMARSFMNAVFSSETEMCLTEADAEEGYRQFAEGMSQCDDSCEMTSYETTSNSFSSVMTCDDGTGSSGTTTVSGDVTGTSMDMTMTMEGTDPQMGEMRMVIRMQSERIGECTAESEAAAGGA